MRSIKTEGAVAAFALEARSAAAGVAFDGCETQAHAGVALDEIIP